MTLIRCSAATRAAVWSCLAAAGSLLTSAALGAAAPERVASPAVRVVAPDQAWDTVVADVTVRRARVRRDGTGADPAAPIRYRLERSRVSGVWRTTLRFADESRRLLTLNGTIAAGHAGRVAAVDERIPGDPRLWNGSGDELPVPTAADVRQLAAAMGGDAAVRPVRQALARATGRPASAAAEAFDGLVLPRGGAPSRRAALQRSLGPVQGRVKGLDRFVGRQGGRTRETLVDPVTQLPREVNDVEAGRLVAHRTFQYDALAGEVLVRRGWRTEVTVADGSDDRLITDVAFTNLRFERRR